ncbi:MAG: methyl-accepting chemotaxis protein, partial [Phenylobacterium sp.]|uniref:methyl-accepting chemotaxis protein n=1 Tax=Phenylobacterium sp. TaxID=1871053 RepID=UPI0027372165
LAERIARLRERAHGEAGRGRDVAESLVALRAEVSAVADGGQQILVAAVEAEAAAREAQKGAESVSSAAEEQSAAAAEAQRAVHQQAAALEQSRRTAQSLARSAETILATTEAASLAGEIGAAAEELSSTVQELAGAAGEILTAVDQINRGAQIQAAATQQANAALTQIERAADQAGRYAGHALQGVEAIQASLSLGREQMRALNEGVAAALVETHSTLAATETLDDQVRAADKLVDAIALVAVQTNMLAVSGAVEAARARDAGRGFSTVSADIRNLSREASANAEHIKDVVTEIQRQLAAVRRDLEQVAAGSDAEIEKNQRLDARLATMAADVAVIHVGARETVAGASGMLDAVREATEGARQIALAAELAASAAAQSATAARQQARGAEDLAGAIEEIASLADELQAVP